MRRAAWILAGMAHGRPCWRQAMQRAGVVFGIIAAEEQTTDIPEYADSPVVFPNINWDTRGRGFGATLMRPLSTGAEENLLQELPDPWHGEVIFLHETAHTLWELGVRDLLGGDDAEAALQAAYQAALGGGLWVNTYAITAAREYWAEGVQSFFDDNIEADPPNGIHNHVDTCAELEGYDPALAGLISAHIDPPAGFQVDCALAPDAVPAQWPVLPPAAVTGCEYERPWPEDLGCPNEATLSKAPDAGQVQVQVVVRRFEDAVQVHTPDAAAQRSLLQTVPPRTQPKVSVPNGGRVVLTDADGSCLGIYEATAALSRVAVP